MAFIVSHYELVSLEKQGEEMMMHIRKGFCFGSVPFPPPCLPFFTLSSKVHLSSNSRALFSFLYHDLAVHACDSKETSWKAKQVAPEQDFIRIYSTKDFQADSASVTWKIIVVSESVEFNPRLWISHTQE